MFYFKRKSPPANSGKKRMERKKVAIVGSGCAGIGAVWALKHSDYEVHLFEKSPTLGGHTNTQFWRHEDKDVPVDTGFIVMNPKTYPNFIRFLQEVEVDIVPTDMTFSVSRNRGAFEWSGESQGLFAQKRNLFRPRHWRLIFDIIRFNEFALDVLAEDEGSRMGSTRYPKDVISNMSIGEYLNREGYSQAFRDDYLIPMTAAVWSTSPDKASLEFPAETLIRFMWNHHLLCTFAERPQWLTIPGGSHRYIEAVINGFPAKRLHVHTSCEVANVLRPSRKGESVNVSWINAKSGRIEGDTFDHVILACHGDEILPLLAKHGSLRKVKSSTSSGSGSEQSDKIEKPEKSSSKSEKSRKNSSGSNGSTVGRSTAGFSKSSAHTQYVSQEEIDIFSAFQTSQNVCYLHSDLALMPKRRNVWTSWNYLVGAPHASSEKPLPTTVSLTYNMNILQHIPVSEFGHVLVTMNPLHPPEPALVQGKFHYRHPLYTVAAVAAQQQLAEQLQNKRGVSYCGAWTKYGFHEDGFSSGLKVAIDHLGAKIPFEFTDSTFSRGRNPQLDMRDYAVRSLLLVVLAWVRGLEWFVGLPGVSLVVLILSGLCSILLSIAEFVRLI